MPRKRESTDKVNKKLSNNTEPERPLHYHEMMRMLCMGHIPPGDYFKETVYMDGRVKIESFRVDDKGRIRDIQCSIEKPGPRHVEKKKREGKARTLKKRR